MDLVDIEKNFYEVNSDSITVEARRIRVADAYKYNIRALLNISDDRSFEAINNQKISPDEDEGLETLHELLVGSDMYINNYLFDQKTRIEFNRRQ